MRLRGLDVVVDVFFRMTRGPRTSCRSDGSGCGQSIAPSVEWALKMVSSVAGANAACLASKACVIATDDKDSGAQVTH